MKWSKSGLVQWRSIPYVPMGTTWTNFDSREFRFLDSPDSIEKYPSPIPFSRFFPWNSWSMKGARVCALFRQLHEDFPTRQLVILVARTLRSAEEPKRKKDRSRISKCKFSQMKNKGIQSILVTLLDYMVTPQSDPDPNNWKWANLELKFDSWFKLKFAQMIPEVLKTHYKFRRKQEWRRWPKT